MSLGPQQFGRRESGALHLRADALRLSWTLEDLATADSHVMRVRFTCSAQVAQTDADRKMFREVFLASQPVVTVADVTKHFEAPLRAAAAKVAGQYAAEQWVGEKQSEMQSALVSAGKAVAFACGLEILPPFATEITSASLERTRMESIQRARAEERVAGQVQHLQRAGELLKQFDALREQMPDLTPGELLEHINPVDRGSTLQSLLLASANQSRQHVLWAVAGPSLVRIDTSQSPPRTELIALPAELGPLRSVQPASVHGRSVLLVGARGGVMLVPPDSPRETQVYRDPRVQSQLGFNRAVARGEEIWASHGEAGVVGWKLGETSEPFARFHENPGGGEGETGAAANIPSPTAVVSVGGSPSLMVVGSRNPRPAGPRNLQLLDSDHLVYSVGNELIVLRPDAQPQALPAETTAEIIAIFPANPRAMFVVHADSTVAILSRESRQVLDRQRRAGRVCAAGALPWLGSVRLLLVDNDGPIDCVGFDDPLITQYVSQHRAPRVVTASPARVAALSSDRQRIILWETWDGRAPVAEVHITGIARHRVADVEFGE